MKDALRWWWRAPSSIASRKRRESKQPATIVNPKEGPKAFARASPGVGTTRSTRANSFSSSTPTCQRMILISRKILLHSNYEGTDLEELARDIGFRPVDQTDAGKLARS
jgi:hypothetical protein